MSTQEVFWACDLQGLASQGVLVVSITIVGSDAAGVPQGGGRLVPERTLRHRSSRSRIWAAADGKVETRRVGASSVRVSYSKGSTEVIHHGGNQGATQDAIGDEGGKGDSEGSAEAQAATGDPRGGLPSGVVRQVAAE